MISISEEIGKRLNAVTAEEHRFHLSVLVKSKLLHNLNIGEGQVNVAKVREQSEGAGGKSGELLVGEDKPLNLKCKLLLKICKAMHCNVLYPVVWNVVQAVRQGPRKGGLGSGITGYP